MPQLNPTPWFLVLLFSWMVLLVIIPPKVMHHHFTGDPTHHSAKEQTQTPWNWPWH
uniref:ATP synthase complex subunit 8 n=1 Tax=Arapaima gigas TaxID=113544 RepID=Q859Z4_ARAGI|nr:ATP synthase F0 subunit 8 [Arapaima gigas]AAM08973.1 ATPase subunit 8 [Arapaima gigas]AAM08977.1 ATPase subunit 8 [Arapaima gigas]AAM08981.1 ATPase subunit 8 [Arapaima gigas]AAM08985.1 ATPase subunit 8 [Arapaima gigas]AAM08989.1 ATPase subunit 8 [Arapaima gigas]